MLCKDYFFIEDCRVYYENDHLKFNPLTPVHVLNKEILKKIDLIVFHVCIIKVVWTTSNLIGKHNIVSVN